MSEPGTDRPGAYGGPAQADEAFERILGAHRERLIAQAKEWGWEEEGLNATQWQGRWFPFRALPSERTPADIKHELRDYGCHLYTLEGSHLRWLLYDPCTHALEHGLHGQKMQEDDVARAAKAARRKVKEQLAAEEAEEKRRGRGRRKVI